MFRESGEGSVAIRGREVRWAQDGGRGWRTRVLPLELGVSDFIPP